MLEWDRTIIAYVKRQAHRILWACPVYETEDLVQEGWLVFDRLSKSHGREQLVERHGEIDDRGCRAAWMALFKVALRNRYSNIVRSAARRITIDPEEGRRPTHSFMQRTWWCSGSRSTRAVEIACDLEHAPGIRRILESASWDDGVARIREPRKLRNGGTETRADVLQRLVGRRAVGDFDAQLSMVI